MTEYLIGVDLGQAHDYTAIGVVQRDEQPTGRIETRMGNYNTRGAYQTEQTEGAYQVRHLERLPLGTPYPQQVRRVTDVIQEVQRITEVNVGKARWRLVVDQTGVGRPVVDMLRAEGHKRLTAVSIHGGDATTREGRDWRVPKRELVSVLQVLLQTQRLTVARSLAEADTLAKEMLAFRVTITANGHDAYGNDWRENPHDDMVLAVALAVWAGERTSRPADLATLRAANGVAA